MKKSDYDYFVSDSANAVPSRIGVVEKLVKKTFKILRKKKTNFHYTAGGSYLVCGVRHDSGEIIIWAVDQGIITTHDYTPKVDQEVTQEVDHKVIQVGSEDFWTKKRQELFSCLLYAAKNYVVPEDLVICEKIFGVDTGLLDSEFRKRQMQEMIAQEALTIEEGLKSFNQKDREQ